MTLDDQLADAPLAAPSLAGAGGIAAKCRRHEWVRQVVPMPSVTRTTAIVIPDEIPVGPWFCLRCGTVKDEARSRRGRNAAKRGKRIQHDRIVALGGRNLAGNNENLDGLGEMFAYESKSGAAFSDRYWRWLTGIPKRGNETGVLIVTEAPGPGHKARSYVVVEYDEWKDLHGE
jgi:hypothetical protein